MQINNSVFAGMVGAVVASGVRYTQIAEGFAKHLPYTHSHTSQNHAKDQSSGMIPAGVVFCVDGIYGAKPRNAALMKRNGGVSDHPANGERIAMAEWPTQARIRNVRVVASQATFNPGSVNPDYFSPNTAAAFPAFTLQAVDPLDPSFVVPLLDTDADGVKTLSLAAIAFGVNRRKHPLIIEAVLGGAVVDNSLLAVYCEFVIPHT